MSTHRSRWLVALVAGVLVSASMVQAATPGSVAAAAASDPMAAVNKSVRFRSTGTTEGAWSWLRSPEELARWDFKSLPASPTDLVVDLAVRVPDGADVAAFTLRFGTGGPRSDEALGGGTVRLTASDEVARGQVTIPAATVPDGTTELWISAQLPGADASPVAFRSASVRFAPVGSTGRGSGAAPVPPPPSSTTQPPPTTKPRPGTSTTATTVMGTGLPFASDGDLVAGWYWLRDDAHQQTAHWELTVPRGARSVRLDFDVLATTGLNGPAGEDARFYVRYGPLPEKRSLDKVPVQLVTIPNVSAPNDPVGYTAQGSVTPAGGTIPVGTRKLWVQVLRRNPKTGSTVDDVVAVRANSVTVANADTVTATTSTSTTTSTITTTSTSTSTSTSTTSTSTSTSTTTTPNSGGGGGGGGGTVADCSTTAAAVDFSPIESAARYFTDSGGTKWFLLRTRTADEDPVTDELPEDYWNPVNQSATWRFTKLPGSGDQVTFEFAVPAQVVPGEPDGPFTLSVTYGAVPAGTPRIAGPVELTLTKTTAASVALPRTGNPEVSTAQQFPESYPVYLGSVSLNRSVLDAGAGGYWLRVTAVDPTNAVSTLEHPIDPNDHSYPGYPFTHVQALLNQSSVTACLGSGSPVVHDVVPSVTAPTITYDEGTKRLSSDRPIFVDPATDPDGDGIDQAFENAAMERVNPRLLVDEEERWRTHSQFEKLRTFVRVGPWPSFQDTRYVVFDFLETWGYDAGIPGVSLPSSPSSLYNIYVLGSGAMEGDSIYEEGGEIHRGDSEKAFEAYRVIDDHTLQLDSVYTSAHANETGHDGLWRFGNESCNVGHFMYLQVHTALVSGGADALEDGTALSAGTGAEDMCTWLKYTGDGRVLLAASENKHGMYPSVAVCEAVTLLRLQLPSVSDFLLALPGGSTMTDLANLFGADATTADAVVGALANQMGVGNFTLTAGAGQPTVVNVGENCYGGSTGDWVGTTVVNVGEPGNWMVNDLDSTSSWRGLGAQKTNALRGAYPGEAVWTGRRYVDSSSFSGALETSAPVTKSGFCGGRNTTEVQNGATVHYTSACTGILGQKLTDFQPQQRARMLEQAP